MDITADRHDLAGRVLEDNLKGAVFHDPLKPCVAGSDGLFRPLHVGNVRTDADNAAVRRRPHAA